MKTSPAQLTRVKTRQQRNRAQGLCACGRAIEDLPGKTCRACRDYHRKRRAMVLDHYGRVCACCGEAEKGFLTLDHIDNSGTSKRKTLASHVNLAYWLIKHDYPEGYQILCWNCNQAKRILGECPHEIVQNCAEQNSA